MMNKLNKERKRRNNDQSNEQWCVIYSICSSRKMRRSSLHENIVYGYYCFPLKIIVHDYRKSRLLNTVLSNCGNIFPIQGKYEYEGETIVLVEKENVGVERDRMGSTIPA